MTTKPFEHLTRPDGHTIAYQRLAGTGPTVVWLGGFKSDMMGTKAQALADWAQGAGASYLRFDYFGHGLSSGDFTEGTIGRWRGDTLAVMDELTTGPLVLVGSSMGGWMAGLAALARPERIAGLMLIAPAPDFTIELMEPILPPEAKVDLAETGQWQRPSAYDDEPYIITQNLLDEARQWAILDKTISINGPLRILHGMADVDVPYMHGLRFAEQLKSLDLTVTLVKGGDHRLSTPADLQRMISGVEDVRRIASNPSR